MQSIIFAGYSSSSDARYVAWQFVIDNNDHVFFNDNKENNFQTYENTISDNNGVYCCRDLPQRRFSLVASARKAVQRA